MVRALVLTPGEPVAIKEVAPELETLRREIGGGWLEHVKISDDAHMYIDEDGKSKGLTMNPTASVLMWAFAQYRLSRSDYIAGTAIILSDDGNGEEADAPESVITLVRQIEQGISEQG